MTRIKTMTRSQTKALAKILREIRPSLPEKDWFQTMCQIYYCLIPIGHERIFKETVGWDESCQKFYTSFYASFGNNHQ